MPKRVAVVADAISAEHAFPIWHRYYGGLFGPSNIFLVTYEGLSAQFRGFEFGGLIELPVPYDNPTRRSALSHLVASLLACYDMIIRVDADEFLVVDPRVAHSLADYLEGLSTPYVTARGFDVIQLFDDAALPARPNSPVLLERTYAYPNTALNKTCVVTMPVNWSDGFHWANVYPKFGPLFMLHTKRLDINWQLNLFAHMSLNIKDNPRAGEMLRSRYVPDETKIREYHRGVENRRRLQGIESWYRDELIVTFLDKLRLSPSGLYSGDYGHEHVLCEIPQEWKVLI
jgi:hypothetical protein